MTCEGSQKNTFSTLGKRVGHPGGLPAYQLESEAFRGTEIKTPANFLAGATLI